MVLVYIKHIYVCVLETTHLSVNQTNRYCLSKYNCSRACCQVLCERLHVNYRTIQVRVWRQPEHARSLFCSPGGGDLSLVYWQIPGLCWMFTLFHCINWIKLQNCRFSFPHLLWCHLTLTYLTLITRYIYLPSISSTCVGEVVLQVLFYFNYTTTILLLLCNWVSVIGFDADSVL